MRRLFVLVSFVLAGCSVAPQHATPPVASPATPHPATVTPPSAPLALAPFEGPIQLVKTPNPDGHPEFLKAISESKKSIKMEMFHLSDPEVIQALVDAKKRGVVTQVILDFQSMTNDKFKNAFDILKSAGVEVQTSSPAFSITHAKTLIVDDSTTLVTAINLTQNAATTRDFGLILHDPKVIKDLDMIFETDLKNATNQGDETPKINDKRLVVSPMNTRSRLTRLIAEARKTLALTVENLGDPVIQDALKDAANHGVRVRVIVPMCDKNKNPLYNYRHVAWLSDHHIEARVMPTPATARTPYMHSKMILADGATAYVGSANFSVNSTVHAREIGILFSEPAPVSEISRLFEEDWIVAVTPPSPPPTDCPPLGD